MVGILTPTSAGKAAALLTSKNPAAALTAHEQANKAANAKVMAAGRPKRLEDNGIKPLGKIPAAAQAKLDATQQLMESLQLRATPALIWRDKGEVQTRTGVPDGALAADFGPP